MKFLFICLCLLVTASSVFSGDKKVDQTPKIRLAIFDFLDTNNHLCSDGSKLSLLIFSELSNHDDLELLDREDIKKIFKEHNLSYLNQNSGKQMLTLGEFLGADYILTGQLYKFMGQTNVNGKLSHCSTGRRKGIALSMKNNTIESVASEITSYVLNQLVKKPTK